MEEKGEDFLNDKRQGEGGTLTFVEGDYRIIIVFRQEYLNRKENRNCFRVDTERMFRYIYSTNDL